MQRRVSQLLLSSHKGQILDFDRKSIEIAVYSLDHYTIGMKGIFPNRRFLRVADTKTVQNQCKRSYRIAKDLWMITFFMVLVRKSEFGMVAQCIEYTRIRKSPSTFCIELSLLSWRGIPQIADIWELPEQKRFKMSASALAGLQRAYEWLYFLWF